MLENPGEGRGALPPFLPALMIKSTHFSSFMMMWFTKIAAQVVDESITRVGSREGNGCDLVFYLGPPFSNSGSDPETHLKQ
jgi:hypothetical protein